MKVYRIISNGCLLLVDNDYVVNGGYNLSSLPSHMQAEFIMDAPIKGHYNDVLAKAEEILRLGTQSALGVVCKTTIKWFDSTANL